MDKRDGLASTCRTLNLTLPIPLATATARTTSTRLLITRFDELMST